MHNHIATIEQVALYLGAPWKLNRLEESSDWRWEIIDGSGRGFFIRLDNQKKQFRISGQYPRPITSAYRQGQKTIGVGLTRPPKDIAADITRRLLPDYLKAFEGAKTRHAKECEQAQHIQLIAKSLEQVTGGRISSHSGDRQKNVYFTKGEAEIYAYSSDVKLTLHSLPPELAIKIAALVSKPASPKKYEVQHYTLCDGWVNTWYICENGNVQSAQVFDSIREAQAELDEFFVDIAAEIKSGERKPDSGYDRAEFRIVPVTR